MKTGASTPEELESLLEDAFVMGDHEALVALFERGAVLAAGGASDARGGREIAQSTAAMCGRGYRYLADPRRVLQARDTALVVAERGLGVMRLGRDRRWRYAISLLNVDEPTGGDRR
jgi:hypothetical protein